LPPMTRTPACLALGPLLRPTACDKDFTLRLTFTTDKRGTQPGWAQPGAGVDACDVGCGIMICF
jgi:hypothetical protein